ncbi:MAG: flavodoxin family protein [bacterium]|nr:flavodoxin family protein [bacterium]
MRKLLLVSGSPTKESSTDRLLDIVADACIEALGEPVEKQFIKISDLQFILCQACGKAPTPDFCFFHEIDKQYDMIVQCDVLIFGSPIYFDNVSAQAKAFIDRCNCFRPYDFKNVDPEHSFLKLLPKKRPGAMVFVGGESGWFEGARRTVVGFFKWIEIASVGMVTWSHEDVEVGLATKDDQVVEQAKELGRKLATAIREQDAG